MPLDDRGKADLDDVLLDRMIRAREAHMANLAPLVAGVDRRVTSGNVQDLRGPAAVRFAGIFVLEPGASADDLRRTREKL